MTNTPPPKNKPSARRRSREFVVQGIYQWLLSGNDAGMIDAQIRDMDGFKKADHPHYDALLHGIINEASLIDEKLSPHTDRKTKDLSPIEHAVLMLGVYELIHCLDVPYRVVINEAVELTKTFGGTDGFRYVNGVLDRAAEELRPHEFSTQKSKA